MRIYYAAISVWNNRAYVFDHNEFFLSEEERNVFVENMSHNSDIDITIGADTINEPEPQGLDEAAEESATKEGLLDGPVHNAAVRTFKAGAKWMAEQGMIITGNIRWTKGPYIEINEEQLYSAMVKGGFEVDDEIIAKINKSR